MNRRCKVVNLQNTNYCLFQVMDGNTKIVFSLVGDNPSKSAQIELASMLLKSAKEDLNKFGLVEQNGILHENGVEYWIAEFKEIVRRLEWV